MDFHELIKLLARQKRVLKAKAVVDLRRKERQDALDVEADARTRAAAAAEAAAAERAAAEARIAAARGVEEELEAARRAADVEAAEARIQAAADKRAALKASGADQAFTNMLREELERSRVREGRRKSLPPPELPS